MEHDLLQAQYCYREDDRLCLDMKLRSDDFARVEWTSSNFVSDHFRNGRHKPRFSTLLGAHRLDRLPESVRNHLFSLVSDLQVAAIRLAQPPSNGQTSRASTPPRPRGQQRRGQHGHHGTQRGQQAVDHVEGTVPGKVQRPEDREPSFTTREGENDLYRVRSFSI